MNIHSNELLFTQISLMKDSIQKKLVAARRDQILDAAAKVFAEKGFHPATIKDVAKEAGIADGTIYNYFQNKADLLIGILDRLRESTMQNADFSTAIDMDIRSFMQVYLRHPLMALKADNFELFRAIVAEITVNADLRELYCQKILEPRLANAAPQFQQWAEQGIIRPLDFDLTVRTISSLIMGLMLQHMMGDKTLEARWDELPDFLTDLILDGIRNKEQ
jgi:AcrR family transcriptional regulator